MVPKEIYKHAQTGWWILLIYGILIIAAILSGASQEIVRSISFIIPILIVLVVFILFFPHLTVIVDNDSIKIIFGIGLIRKSFKFTDIKSCTIVRNKWWYGWGIRWLPHGLLFNIWGLDAVELLMNNGKIYRIGTDEPQELYAVIKSKLTK
jgi:hypothetical protein